MVQIHAQISEVARPVLDRVLNAIVDEIVQDALGCFKQVKRFGMGGMLRVSLVSSGTAILGRYPSCTSLPLSFNIRTIRARHTLVPVPSTLCPSIPRLICSKTYFNSLGTWLSIL